MSLMRDDYLLRQLQALIDAVVEAVTGQAQSQDLDTQCEAIAGLSLETAALLPVEAVIGLLTHAGGLDAQASLALGLGLISRSQSPSCATSQKTRRQGMALVEAATAARPALMTAALRRALYSDDADQRS